MLLPLTDVQNEVFKALQAFMKEHDYPPTTAELSKLVGKKNVGGELLALRKKGWAEKIEGGKRSTVPTQEAIKKFEDSK